MCPVFIWDGERVEHGSSNGLPWWLHHALLDLSKSFRPGGQLLLLRGKAEEVIPRLARELGAKQVYYGGTYDPSGIETQAKVEDALDQASIILSPPTQSPAGT